MEAIMAIVRFKTLCAAAVAATMITVSPALGRDMDDGMGSCKACPSWRSPASSDAPPVMGLTFGAYPYGPMQFENPYGPFQGEKADTLPPRTKRGVHKR
jgi:hypothetical protein